MAAEDGWLAVERDLLVFAGLVLPPASTVSLSISNENINRCQLSNSCMQLVEMSGSAGRLSVLRTGMILEGSVRRHLDRYTDEYGQKPWPGQTLFGSRL